VLVAALAPLGCGGAQSAPGSASVPVSVSVSASASAPAAGAGSTPAPAPKSKEPSARVIAIASSNTESGNLVRAKIVFDNPTARPCQFKSYALSWAGARKEVKLDNFTIPAGETRERSLKVHPEDGKVEALTVESARVEVQTDCDAP